MNAKHIYILILLWGAINIPVLVEAQGVSRGGEQEIDTVERFTKVADQLYEEGKYYAAAELYGKVLIKEESPYILNRLAKANRLGRFYNFAALWYEDLANKYPEEYPLTFYWLGMMRKADGGQYQQAIEAFEEFLKMADKLQNITYEEYSYYIKNAKKEIKACEYAISESEKKKSFRVYNIGENINKKESEFGAVLRNDSTLLFTGAKKITSKNVKKFLFIKTKETYDTLLLNRLYKSINRDNYWQERSVIYMPMGDDRNYDIGSPSPIPYKDAYLVTLCKGSFGKKQCQIYKSKSPSLGKWMRPEKLPEPINNKNSSSKNPAISIEPTGDTILIYSSDRKGGLGGFDLWASKLSNGTFQEPVNLGKTINTPQDEVSPYYDAENATLYFSSNGHFTLGEFDVFTANGNTKKGWDTAKNVGAPINGPTDDYYYVQYQKDNEIVGYFSSNRTGGASEQGTCCDDIYFFKKPLQEGLFVKGSIVDETKQNPINKASLKAIDANGDTFATPPLKSNATFAFNLTKEEGQLNITAPNYQSKQVSLPSPKTATSDTIDLQEISLSALTTEEKLSTIHYNFGSKKLTAESKKQLDQISKRLKQSEDQKLIIASHTDNVDNKQFNLKLSQQRTQQVIDYLTQKGINKERLIGQWYGEFKPIADNQTADGQDNPEGRAQNRRTEFKLVSASQEVEAGQMMGQPAIAAKKQKTPASSEQMGDKAFSEMKKKYGNKQMDDLVYKVQVGAYKHPKPNMFDNLTEFGPLTTDTTQQGVVKFMIGKAHTLQEAYKLKEELRKNAEPKAWTVAYHKGNRISILKAIELIAQNH